MVPSPLKMSGLEKASILLMSLGSAASNEVLEHLTPEQRELLGAQITRMRRIRPPTQQQVLDEVSRHVQEIEDDTCLDGSRHPEPPLRWLERCDPAEVAGVLSRERPHNAALVIAHLSANGAAAVLPLLDEDARNQVTHRLATMGRASAEAARAADRVMRDRLLNRSESNRRVNRQIAASSTVASARPSSARAACGSPEDLSLMPDAELRGLLAQLDTEDLCLALTVASPELTSSVLANVGGDVGLAVKESLAGPTQPRVRDVEAAQRRIMTVLSGTAGVSRGGTESE